tara:strand:- start:122 stop:439 length:318 start_codon:yes stop_codon:yes gene_type:complete
MSGVAGAITVFEFGEKEKLTGQFISISEEKNPPGIMIFLNVDEQDRPFKYFGLTASKAIINTGSESLVYTGDFKVLKIEKQNNYIISVGAETYERNIRNESDRNS